MKPSEFIVLVRNEIESHGWCQSTFQDKTGAVSIDGAIKLANHQVQLHKMSGGRKITDEIFAQFTEASNAVSTAVTALEDVAKDKGAETIVVFNDMIAKSKADAVRFLNQGIKVLKSRHA